MNNKKIIDESIKLIDQWRAIEQDMRNYEHENWHCVNVKRHNDYIDLDELIKNYKPDEKDFLLDYYQDESGNIKNFIYYEDFLQMQGWEQLNHEISDIEEITKGARDEHKKFKYLKTAYDWVKGSSILALGRSGGWACFQTTEENTADEIESILDGITNDKREIIETDAEELGNRLTDLDMYNEQLAGAIEEVLYIKQYIKKFNDGLSFKEFLQSDIDYRLSEYQAERDKEAKKQAEDLPDLLEFVNAKMSSLIKRLNLHKKNKEVKAAIMRNVKSIQSIINKEQQK